MSEVCKKVTQDLYEYCPGNCTRYYILATKIAPSNFDPGASLAFMWLLLGDRGGKGMIVDVNAPLDLGYFQGKTGIANVADAVPLLCFLAENFGVRIGGIPKEYENHDWFLKLKERMPEEIVKGWF